MNQTYLQRLEYPNKATRQIYYGAVDTSQPISIIGITFALLHQLQLFDITSLAAGLQLTNSMLK